MPDSSEVGEVAYKIRESQRLSWQRMESVLNCHKWWKLRHAARKYALASNLPWPITALRVRRTDEPYRQSTLDKARRSYELRENGLSWPEIADRIQSKRPGHALAVAKIHAVTNELPWPLHKPRKPRMSENDRQRRIDLYNSGLTIKEVAEQTGVSKSAIWQVLNHAGALPKQKENPNVRKLKQSISTRKARKRPRRD